jgi:hypothetical protein
MKRHRCAGCGNKLGLGVRFRNLWNGTTWLHLRFCSANCETRNELVRRNATRPDRWFSYLVTMGPKVVELNKINE